MQFKEYLVENGIDEFRLSSLGYGESKPIEDNGTMKGRKSNRRAEINRSAKLTIN